MSVEPEALTRLFERDLAELARDRRRLVARLHPIEAWALMALVEFGLRDARVDGTLYDLGRELVDRLDHYVVGTLAMRVVKDLTWPPPLQVKASVATADLSTVGRLIAQLRQLDDVSQICAGGGAWLLGHDAGEAGRPADDNPFNEDQAAKLRAAWWNGWRRGQAVRQAREQELVIWP